MRISWIVASLVLGLFLPPPIFAQDLVGECNVCLHKQIEPILGNLRKLEEHYIYYRWAEAKIRQLYYERLWKARRDSMDPFSKTVRKVGEAEEKRLLEALTELEKESLGHSNGFSETLLMVQNTFSDFKKCCPEKKFADCIASSFKRMDERVVQMRTEFEHVFEQEREYRNAVLLTAGGREGLYPEDAVEVPALHGEYYWRFAAELEPKRFGEDQRIRDFLYELEKSLTSDFEGKRCCLECGRK